MWARSTSPQAGRRPVWHRVTVASWDPGKLLPECHSGGHVLQRRSCEQRTDPPLTDGCASCLRVGKEAS